jgi:negative regulator of sigma E activity
VYVFLAQAITCFITIWHSIGYIGSVTISNFLKSTLMKKLMMSVCAMVCFAVASHAQDVKKTTDQTNKKQETTTQTAPQTQSSQPASTTAEPAKTNTTTAQPANADADKAKAQNTTK